MSIEELKELLDQYDHAYYNLDESLISDVEYDALKERYLHMIAGVENVVGGSASKQFNRVPHQYPILSLEKVKDRGTLNSKMVEFETGVIQPKLDGLTIVVYGKNTLGPNPIWATRGSGTEGEDVSLTASQIPGLVPIDNIIYRAEIFMPKAKFKEINAERIANGEEPFSNPRNAAAGMIRQLDPSKVKGLTYYAYNIVGSALSEEKQLELLKLAGIRVVSSRTYENKVGSMQRALEWVINFSKEDREKLPYEIDGMVIKSNLPNSLERFGSTGHHPKNAVAFKYPTEAKWSILRDVQWQLGKNGQVTPVALFDPIDLMGSTVSRATLHNEDYIRALKLYINCDVSVTKANEIIPKIIDAKYDKNDSKGGYKAIHTPTHCPVCSHMLIKDGANLFCRNILCQGTIIAQIDHMAKKEALNIDGLSVKTITKMFDMGYLNSKFDIFNVTVEQIEKLDGFARPSAEKLYKNIQDARVKVPFDKFLYAAGIPLLGRTASKDIARFFCKKNSADPYQALIADMLVGNSTGLFSINGIGDSIVNNLKDNVETLNLLKKYIIIDYNGLATSAKAQHQYTFVITGALYHGTRDAYKERIEALGHKLSGSVSKKTDYLVTNEQTMTTKRQKAEELGIPIIDETEFLELLKTS